MQNYSMGLSPGRLLALNKIRSLGLYSDADIREAMEKRKHLPLMALEFLKNKNLPKDLTYKERFPLWVEYLELTDQEHLAGEY